MRRLLCWEVERLDRKEKLWELCHFTGERYGQLFSSKWKVNIHLPLFLSNCSKEAKGALSFQSRRVQTTLFQNGKGIKTFIEIIQNGRYENFVVIRRRAHAKSRHHHSPCSPYKILFLSISPSWPASSWSRQHVQDAGRWHRGFQIQFSRGFANFEVLHPLSRGVIALLWLFFIMLL